MDNINPNPIDTQAAPEPSAQPEPNKGIDPFAGQGQQPPADPSSIVDEVIFGTRSADDEALQQLGQDQQGSQQQITPEGTPAPQNNDEVRYNYWQSQADKRQQEVSQLTQTNQLLQQQLNTVIERIGQPQDGQPAAAAPEGPQVEPFPDPPQRPQKPYGYTREEAYTDPTSESGEYLSQMDEWRDNMSEYNHLRGEYDRELLAIERQNFADEQKRIRQAQEQQARQGQETQAIKQQVMQQYGASAEDAENFIRVMSDPASISVDNLWRIYSMNAGNAQSQPQSQPGVVPQMPQQPSPTFTQAERTQQIPSSMGVVPGVNRATDRSVDDVIMDNMIQDYNEKNPWS